MGQHTPNTNQDTPKARICQYVRNLRRYKEFRMRLIRAVAAVSVVNLLGPSEIGENPDSSSSVRSPSENPPGGPTASWIAAFRFWMRPGGRGFPAGSARKRRHPPGTPPPSQVPPRAASNEGEDPNLGRRLRRDCLSA